MFRVKLLSKLPHALLVLLIGVFILYFSLFTIFRYQKLYAHYFDLGIMDQTVYNSYMAIKTGDYSRILELTDPHKTALQVKRMSIHNDVFLLFLAPIYFIHSGPETLLVFQTVVVALGALFIFKIAQEVLRQNKHKDWIALCVAIAYLMYPPVQKANAFDFHSVTLATTFILAMYHFWLQRKYRFALLFAIFSLLTKEQVGLTVAFFGFVLICQKIWKERNGLLDRYNKVEMKYLFTFMLIGLSWAIISIRWIIPEARGSEHFATQYYKDILRSPINFFREILNYGTLNYFWQMLGPVGFLPILSPVYLFFALPEFLINILSSNENMINTYFHYGSLIIPFIFIATIYGLKRILDSKYKIATYKPVGYLLVTVMIASFLYSSLPFSKQKELHPWLNSPVFLDDLALWKKYLSKDQMKVSTTGRIAPYFTSRQYFYDFSDDKYQYADYVIIDIWDKDNGFLKTQTVSAYQLLVEDWKFVRIYQKDGLEVYKKINQ